MKDRIKRRLKLRFVLLSVAAILILQTLIVGFSVYRSYRQMTLRADKIIRLTDTQPSSPEIADARYFKVSASLTDRSFETDLTHTALVSRGAAIDYAKSVIDSKSTRGYIDNYRYLVHRDSDGIHITFLSREMALEAFRANAASLVFISSAGIVIMAILLTALSGTVVAPLVRNRQKQKEFITSASHALKTPLTVISADAQLLESEIGENEWLADIEKQTRHMTEMTHRLVYLARSEEQDGQTQKLDFPISDVAEDVLSSYRAVAQREGKQLTCKLPTLLSYHGDEKAIRELMEALLDNAFKYSPPHGSINVVLSLEGRGVRFAVENAVEHADKSQLSSFTDRFYRADGSANVRGFGIGLSVARAVAENHHGKLTVTAPTDNKILIYATLR